MKSNKQIVDRILKTIFSIHGKKIVTILGGEDEEARVFDVHEDSTIGYDKFHEMLLMSLLNRVYLNGGVIIIRQFTRMSTRTINGRPIPKKNIYGLAVVDQKIIALDKKALKESFSFDHKTGKPLEPEQDVFYRDIVLI